MATTAGTEDYRTLVQKSDLALSDLTSGGGILQPAQRKKFIQLAIEESKVMRMARTETLRSPDQLIEKIVFGSRIMRAGTFSQALTESERSKPTTSKVQFAAKEIVAEVRLGYETVEDNIEAGTLSRTVMGMMVKQAARDMEELILQGDTTSTDSYLALFDGLIAAATTNTYDANDSELDEAVLSGVFRSIPKQFRTRKSSLRFLTATDNELAYNERLGDRPGNTGDSYRMDDKSARWKGIRIEGCHLIPDSLGGGGDQTVMLCTDMDNVIVGIWRRLRLETDRDVSSRQIVFVLTARMDVKYEHEPAVGKGTEIKIAA